MQSRLDRLLSDARLRRDMGRAGRERLEEVFLFHRFRERLKGYLEELMP